MKLALFAFFFVRVCACVRQGTGSSFCAHDSVEGFLFCRCQGGVVAPGAAAPVFVRGLRRNASCCVQHSLALYIWLIFLKWVLDDL